MNSPSWFRGTENCLLLKVVVDFNGWPFPPFEEDIRPTNSFGFDDLTAGINLKLNVLKAKKPLGK